MKSVGLQVLSWSEAVKLAVAGGNPTPRLWDTVRTGIDRADVVIGLLTPDDEVRLRDEQHKPGEQAFDLNPMGQARPNVLIEIGYALGTKPKNTVIVQIGKNRPMTDLIGHYLMELNQSENSREQFLTLLQAAGCEPDISGDQWKTAGNFQIDIPCKPPVHHRFQGNYRGDWHIDNYAQIAKTLEPYYIALVQQAASMNRTVQFNPQLPTGGDATTAVLFDGQFVANLTHGPRIGVFKGLLGEDGKLVGKAQYPGEPETDVQGNVELTGTGQMKVMVVQTLIGLVARIEITAILNRF